MWQNGTRGLEGSKCTKINGTVHVILTENKYCYIHVEAQLILRVIKLVVHQFFSVFVLTFLYQIENMWSGTTTLLEVESDIITDPH